MLSKLYKALVRPITEYADIIWGHYILFNQRKLENAASYNKVGTFLKRQAISPSLSKLVFVNLPSLSYHIFETIFLCDLINDRFKLGYSLPFYTIPKYLHQRRFLPPTQALISSLSLVSTV